MAEDLLEIDAAIKLLKNRKYWLIPNDESKQTLERLRGLMQKVEGEGK